MATHKAFTIRTKVTDELSAVAAVLEVFHLDPSEKQPRLSKEEHDRVKASYRMAPGTFDPLECYSEISQARISACLKASSIIIRNQKEKETGQFVSHLCHLKHF